MFSASALKAPAVPGLCGSGFWPRGVPARDAAALHRAKRQNDSAHGMTQQRLRNQRPSGCTATGLPRYPRRRKAQFQALDEISMPQARPSRQPAGNESRSLFGILRPPRRHPRKVRPIASILTVHASPFADLPPPAPNRD